MAQTHKAQVNGTLRTATENFGDWQVHTGGRLTREASDSRAPGAALPTKAAAPGTIENITLTRDYDVAVDGPIYDRLEALWKTQTQFTIGKVIRDAAGNPVRLQTRVGILLELMDTDGDSNGGADKGTIEAVFGING